MPYLKTPFWPSVNHQNPYSYIFQWICLKLSNKFIDKCRRRNFGDWHLAKCRFEIWLFMVFMAFYGFLWFFCYSTNGHFRSNWLLIGFAPSYQCKLWAIKIWSPYLKIAQDATIATTLNWYNSAIFYPSLTSDHTKMISSSRRINWCKNSLALSHSF